MLIDNAYTVRPSLLLWQTAENSDFSTNGKGTTLSRAVKSLDLLAL